MTSTAQVSFLVVTLVFCDADITYVVFIFFKGGENEDGDDHLESLSRPVSGERTSSHDDSESVGSGAVRPSSAASGRSFTGKLCYSHNNSFISSDKLVLNAMPLHNRFTNI